MRKIFGNLLVEVTSKQQWYSKVFQDNLVAKWKEEFLNTEDEKLGSPVSDDYLDDHGKDIPLTQEQKSNIFDMMIGFARATAQGSLHVDNCDWTEGPDLCNNCIAEERKKLEEEGEENLEGDDWVYDLDMRCYHPRCNCIAPDHDLARYIQYIPQNLFKDDLRTQLKICINKMLIQVPIDWHPGSNNQVRDLVHPSMYCYVRGISKFSNGVIESPFDANNLGDEDLQWLPSLFKITDGKCKISSYINNLDESKYPELIPLLEKSFETFLPPLEQVLHQNLKNKDLQVITKIGTIYLDPTKSKYPGGSWHIEGMPHEHIAATCIHYLDVQNISESFLEFRKPILLDEENCNYPQGDMSYTTHHYGIEEDSHYGGKMNRYLGLIKCSEASSVVFPNTLQHRVKEFYLNGEKGIRTILVFFIVDPSKRIIDTTEIAPQQSIIPRADAEKYRERLMFLRKYFVSLLNQRVFERPYSLCEH